MAKITIIGTGLIGTSLGMALRKSALHDNEVVGTDVERSARAGAQKMGAFSKVEDRLMTAVQDADMVILATPVMAMKELMTLIGPHLAEGCIVTDVGSSKKVVLEWADQILPRQISFVGGHPMAGKETAGPDAAEATLFQDKPYCIIPSIQAEQQAVSQVAALAEAIGAKPFFISVDEHDSFVAAVSHLPFVASVALMNCASRSVNWDDIARVASSGFRDVTRLASGDPVMHRDICVSNPKPIVAWIDSFIRELYQVRNLLDTEPTPDNKKVQDMFERAFAERARWMAGKVTPESRNYNPNAETPTFAEGMGQMFLGRSMMETRKRILDGLPKDNRKKK